MPVRIVIVEDEEIFLDSLIMLLSGANTIEIMATYSSGEDAINKIPDMAPDVALVDLKLHDVDISGIDVIKEIKRTIPATEVLVFTKFDDDRHLFSALKAGAEGYVLKDAAPREILEALKSVYNGGAPMSRKIARRVLEEFHDKPRIKGQNKITLTARETEILKELSMGFHVRS